jgi:malate dehydrogenase (oxaloacetate-decarboxylating)(NADP+)
MEGKAVLFKKFGGIDVFDIELNTTDPDELIRIVKALEPTFGGINLEDIKAPECFYIESKLKEILDIPVMHDDQHGTAIISAAAMLNALEIVDKNIKDIKLVVSGAGAAAISTSLLYLKLGLNLENIVMLDSKGVIRKDRPKLSDQKIQFATSRDIHSLDEAIEGADMFLGLSKADILTPEMLKSMADSPIVFALANPDPEINYETAVATRSDLIMATGRSDHPNQVNNVLGFPFIFRGALDVKATTINEEMKLAAVNALASLARQPIPELVARAYLDRKLSFGKDYLIPKPLDPRLITTVATEVAKAAMETGVARVQIDDWDKYAEELENRIGTGDKLLHSIINRAKKYPKRIVFAEADNYKILKAVQSIIDIGIAQPVLLGNKELIRKTCEEYQLDLT